MLFKIIKNKTKHAYSTKSIPNMLYQRGRKNIKKCQKNGIFATDFSQ
jgi:hypothetical protein